MLAMISNGFTHLCGAFKGHTQTITVDLVKDLKKLTPGLAQQIIRNSNSTKNFYNVLAGISSPLIGFLGLGTLYAVYRDNENLDRAERIRNLALGTLVLGIAIALPFIRFASCRHYQNVVLPPLQDLANQASRTIHQ